MVCIYIYIYIYMDPKGPWVDTMQLHEPLGRDPMYPRFEASGLRVRLIALHKLSKHPDLPKVRNSAIYPKSYVESLFDFQHIPYLSSFGSSGQSSGGQRPHFGQSTGAC